ncbi:uncharacterized protein LOC124885762 [Capsicum annuum]|uniref:uncharacterized protein LOC124885762 n=1 Tax=Capsicum annuum TaxID=4072 RepID=UPI001FB1724E|nr:uncharacterized protein LOC124885762 [Capsicum annuum]
MADRFVKRPIGILYDVLVEVADFIFYVDFVVLDYDMDFKVPIFLGRPFLATGRVIVDIDLNKLKFRINEKEAKFAIHSPMTQQNEMSVFSIGDVFYVDGREEPLLRKQRKKKILKVPLPPPPIKEKESEEGDTDPTTQPDSTDSEQPESEHADFEQPESEGPLSESPSVEQQNGKESPI